MSKINPTTTRCETGAMPIASDISLDCYSSANNKGNRSLDYNVSFTATHRTVSVYKVL
ncbi:MAG: hypothetical protein U9Q89_01845 [Thermodesulfobacteriota bacterium]|nr:hypothetical protein [Thermodesulfobacteriota bacterium]